MGKKEEPKLVSVVINDGPVLKVGKIPPHKHASDPVATQPITKLEIVDGVVVIDFADGTQEQVSGATVSAYYRTGKEVVKPKAAPKPVTKSTVAYADPMAVAEMPEGL